MLYELNKDTILNYLKDADLERTNFLPINAPYEDSSMELLSVQVDNMRKDSYLSIIVFVVLEFKLSYEDSIYKKAVSIPVRYTDSLSGRDGVPKKVIEDVQNGLNNFTDNVISFITNEGNKVEVSTKG